MGEVAEMMLDGTLCEGCGEYMGSDGFGIPRYCSAQCARDRGAGWHEEDDRPRPKGPTRKTHQCKACRRYFRGEQGLRDHQRTTGHEGRGNIFGEQA